MRRVATVVSVLLACLLVTPGLPAHAAAVTTIYVSVVADGSPRVAGRPTDFSATLASGETPLPGKVVSLLVEPYGSSTFTEAGQGTTDQNGNVTIFATLQSNAMMQWSFAGDADNSPSVSAPYGVQIAPRVGLRVNDRTLHRGQRFVATGRTSPVKPGCTVKLWRGELRPLVQGPAPVRLAVATVRADGTYRLAHRFWKSGRMRVSVTVSPCSGNARGLSSSVGIRVG